MTGRLLRLFLLLTLTLALSLDAGAARAAPAQALPGWEHRGEVGDWPYCIDPVEPNVMYWGEGYWARPPIHPPARALDEEPKIWRYNWTTGQRAVVHRGVLSVCDPNGMLYATQRDGTFWRIDPRANPVEERQVERIPTEQSGGGTPHLYSFHPDQGRLWGSGDGGLSWRELGGPLGGRMFQLAVAWADPRVLYARIYSTDDRDAIYASTDAGATWEKRAEFDVTGEAGVEIYTFQSASAPAETVFMRYYYPDQRIGACEGEWRVSTDGARSFQRSDLVNAGCDFNPAVATYTPAGIVTIHHLCQVQVSGDGGATWRVTFDLEDNTSIFCAFRTAENAPANLFLYTTDWYVQTLYYSSDGGLTWSQLGNFDRTNLHLTPYLPLTALAIGDRSQLHTLALPHAGIYQTAPAQDMRAPGGSFFPETAHNLWGPLKRYWEQHRGLAQFGYPRTEPFREVNPADGKVYLVQYFERNRLEYHPEHRGTPYEVQLGLLGNQLTAERVAAGEAPFQRVADPGAAGLQYFPETGHTLGGAFRAYWEQHGGLAIYGYPISQEFQERNPDDGKTYTVQYFERARFEHHPEHRGTRYEVLLGLLGNTLLRQKGWLPPS